MTLSGVAAGSHVVSVSLPAYQPRKVTVTVSDGIMSPVTASLTPRSVRSVMSALDGRITMSYRVDQSTGKAVIGPAISSLTASQAAGKTIYAVSTIKLKDPATNAPQAASLSYALYDPNGQPLASLPAPQHVSLTGAHPTTTFASGFKLPVVGVTHLPSGTYTIRLLVDGTVLKDIPIRLTK
jgi:hypothetical protein